MSTAKSAEPGGDTLDVARAILEESMGATNRHGWPIVDDPRYAVRCPLCNERVEARLEINGPASTHYVLPVDSEGRCTSCVLTLCLRCDGRSGGCPECNWTGIEAGPR